MPRAKNSLVDFFRDGRRAPDAGEEPHAKAAINRLAVWRGTRERIQRLHHALTGNTSRETKRLTHEQAQDLRELLGDSESTTQFIHYAETALHVGHELDIGLDILGKKRLRALREAAEKMRFLASVIERAERGNIEDGLPPREIALAFYFVPTLAKQIADNPVQAWRMADTGQVRAWMEAVEDTAQHLLAGTEGKGRDKNRCRHVAIRWLEKGWNETQPDPDAKDMFIRAVTIILTPQNNAARIRKLQARPRRLAASGEKQRELAELERADNSARDRIRHQVSAALKIQG